MKHASIIPLIGGETIGSEQAYGQRPDYLLSYSPFKANDSHLVNHYGGEVPYILLDEGGSAPHRVDVMSSVCPCAGLSLLSGKASADNEKNKWMTTVAEYVMGDLKPEVYWGENAPQLARNMGAPVRDELRRIGLKHGYSMTIYLTKSLLHGVPQVRERTFYFFWKGDRVPVLEYFARPRPTIQEVILGTKGNSQTEPINQKTPSKDDPYYRYILEEMHAGATHRDFVGGILDVESARNTVISYIHRKTGADWPRVARWMDEQGYEKEGPKCLRRQMKLDQGLGFMMWGTSFPKDYIGAFVSHMPHSLTHPTLDRYITYREAMTIMGLPQDFELLNPTRSINHMCQNVPVPPARDMAGEVRAYLGGRRETIKARYVFQSNLTQQLSAGEDEASMERVNPGSTLEEFFAA